MRSRLLPLAIAVTCHALALYLLAHIIMQKPARAPSALSVNIVSPGLTPAEKNPPETKRPPIAKEHQQHKDPIRPSKIDTDAHQQLVKKSNSTEPVAPPSPTSTTMEEGVGTGEVSAAAKPLNRADLLAQAREYGKAVASNDTSVGSIKGDYYGSYSGVDTGTFYFHLDPSGNVSGSGNSNGYHLGFIILGKVSSDGLIEMAGKGIAGTANFSGQLNLKTGVISGAWSLQNLGRGEFYGRRD